MEPLLRMRLVRVPCIAAACKTQFSQKLTLTSVKEHWPYLYRVYSYSGMLALLFYDPVSVNLRITGLSSQRPHWEKGKTVLLLHDGEKAQYCSRISHCTHNITHSEPGWYISYMILQKHYCKKQKSKWYAQNVDRVLSSHFKTPQFPREECDI